MEKILTLLWRIVVHLPHQWEDGLRIWWSAQRELFRLFIFEYRTYCAKERRPLPPVTQTSTATTTPTRNNNNSNNARDLVLVGGGHVHVHLLYQIAREKWTETLNLNSITLITPEPYLVYSGLFPACAAGYYDFTASHVNLNTLAASGNVKLIFANVTAFDSALKTVSYHTAKDKENNFVLNYDLLSINVGSHPELPCHPSFENVITFKPVNTKFYQKWNEMKIQIESKKHLDMIIVGSGAAGTEMALALRQMCMTSYPSKTFSFKIVSSGNQVLSGHNVAAQRIMKNRLVSCNVELVFNTTVNSFISNNTLPNNIATGLKCNDDDEIILFDYCFWCTNAAAESWLSTDSFLQVDKTLRASQNIFAAGDCVSIANYQIPKAGVFAVRQSTILCSNIKSWLCNDDHRYESYEHQESYLSLVGLGNETCLASKNDLAISATWLWDLKQAIDISWVNQYKQS